MKLHSRISSNVLHILKSYYFSLKKQNKIFHRAEDLVSLKGTELL